MGRNIQRVEDILQAKGYCLVGEFRDVLDGDILTDRGSIRPEFMIRFIGDVERVFRSAYLNLEDLCTDIPEQSDPEMRKAVVQLRKRKYNQRARTRKYFDEMASDLGISNTLLFIFSNGRSPIYGSTPEGRTIQVHAKSHEKVENIDKLLEGFYINGFRPERYLHQVEHGMLGKLLSRWQMYYTEGGNNRNTQLNSGSVYTPYGWMTIYLNEGNGSENLLVLDDWKEGNDINLRDYSFVVSVDSGSTALFLDIEAFKGFQKFHYAQISLPHSRKEVFLELFRNEVQSLEQDGYRVEVRGGGPYSV
jgi:hypothetical protein